MGARPPGQSRPPARHRGRPDAGFRAARGADRGARPEGADRVNIVIFTGPTLSAEEGRAVLDARYLAPAAQGDVYRAARHRPQLIGIVDGLFERTPAVWHKEILWAMSNGVHVFGSASLGALRAAELAAFGMEGVGAVFDAFRSGRLEDDDEVAVAHEPAAPYRSSSEAMVDIRATVADPLPWAGGPGPGAGRPAGRARGRDEGRGRDGPAGRRGRDRQDAARQRACRLGPRERVDRSPGRLRRDRAGLALPALPRGPGQLCGRGRSGPAEAAAGRRGS